MMSFQLRLFDGTPFEDRGRWSLSDFFRNHLREKLLDEDCAEGTLKEYGYTLGIWEIATEHATIDALRRDGEAIAKKFTAALRKRTTHLGEPISANTRRKHLVNIQFCLDRLLPKGRHNPWGAGLVADVPILVKPDQEFRDVDDSTATREDLVKLRAACHEAFGGRGRGPRVQLWRDLYELDFWSALRLEALWNVETTWLVDDDVSRQHHGRWLAVPADFSKTGRPYRAFLPAAAAPLLDRLTRRSGRWFEPIMRCETWFYTCRRKVEQIAGINPSSRGMHAIRKLVGTELSLTSDAAAKLQLGHSTAKNVTLTHYVGRVVQAEHCSKRLPLAS